MSKCDSTEYVCTHSKRENVYGNFLEYGDCMYSTVHTDMYLYLCMYRYVLVQYLWYVGMYRYVCTDTFCT